MNKFVRYAKVALMALAAFSFNACGDDDEDAPEVKVEPKVTVADADKNIAFPAEGSEKSVSVTTNVAVTVVPSADWLTVSNVEMQASETAQALQITAAANEGEKRYATVSVKADGVTVNINVEQAAKPSVQPGDATTPAELQAILGMGWNLGNTYDSHADGKPRDPWCGSYPTQATFDAVKAAGFKTVRIPITWLGYTSSKEPYTIDADYLNKIATAVGYAEKAGLNTIINIHHDGADSKYWLAINKTSTVINQDIESRLASMWSQIAKRFADKGSWLIFETMNEIHDGGWGWGANKSDGGTQYARLNKWQQVALDAIRAAGGENETRWVAVQGYVTNPKLTMDNLVLPNDPAKKTIVSVHFYDPNTYTLENKFNAWGDKAAAGSKETWGDEKNVRDIFSALKSKYVDNGIPVYIGEMGATHRATAEAENYRKYYMEYVCKAAKTYGLSPIVWDNGSGSAGKECSGLFHHGTGAFLNNGEEICNIMVNAMENNDPAYTLESVYAKSSDVNGNYGAK